ncbi:metallophosphoesterase [Serpentinicella sp. ANB-PHB4]|uniref:metallophosphoesterase n=1 Tax=Serpentinicella sp. ANB-PHB4 TaxID=3074076 RepID=UPI00285B2F98|nr:metallophosphoesterase [Serpentinicella sp. ANB-PHB4]MDR5659629.1 metallophosphoesterase [Serpentinicella sp. ANB-PHB4]
MNIIEKAKEWQGLILERPYISPELQSLKGPVLLHISDTPREIHRYIVRLVEILQPDYIIHTGDLVDDIKLEQLPHYIDEYKKLASIFIQQLEAVTDAKTYYAMGNHDRYQVIKSISKKGIPITNGHIQIEGINFYINHYHTDEKEHIDYYLYGHSFEPKSYRKEDHTGLNGLDMIHVLDLSTREIYTLPYPFDTDYYRKMARRKIGL